MKMEVNNAPEMFLFPKEKKNYTITFNSHKLLQE